MDSPATREIQSRVLRALADHGQRAVAEAAGISETRLSRWKSGDAAGGGLHLSEVASALAALRLAVVDAAGGETVTVTREEYDALRTLARRALG